MPVSRASSETPIVRSSAAAKASSTLSARSTAAIGRGSAGAGSARSVVVGLHERVSIVAGLARGRRLRRAHPATSSCARCVASVRLRTPSLR